MAQRASGPEGYTRGQVAQRAIPEGKWPRGLYQRASGPEGYTRGLVAWRASSPDS